MKSHIASTLTPSVLALLAVHASVTNIFSQAAVSPIVAVATPPEKDDYTDNNDIIDTATVVASFSQWALKHAKVYSSEADRAYRLSVYSQNADTVLLHNTAFQNGWTSYAMSLIGSPFSDLTDDEFRALYLMEPQNCSATHTATTTAAR